MRSVLSAVAALVVVTTVSTQGGQPAQTPETRTVTFTAASIKKHVGVAGGSFVGRQPGGRLTATAATLRELIEFAYRIQPYQLVEGPKWVEHDRWNVVATLETAPARVAPGAVDDTMLALRALLRDRFKLALRSETRQLPIYSLTLSRTDGRPG